VVFGRKNSELETKIAYLIGRLESLEKSLEKMQYEKPAKSTPDDSEEPKSPISDRLNKRINKLQAALIEKRIQAIEKRIGLAPKDILQESQDYDQETPQNIELSGGNPDLLSAFDSNPMLKIAINMFLRQYGTSIDDLRRDPSKLIPLLETILAKLKEKKAESEATGQEFNPYDPTLFMKK
jgi:hypothetical protein